MANPNPPIHLENLKPWKKGQSGNPGGMPSLPPEIRQARRENMAGLIKLCHLYMGMTSEHAAQRQASPECTLLETAIYGQINRAGEGDARCFSAMVEIMCGKIPETDPQSPTENLTLEEKLSMMRDAVRVLESQVKASGSGST